MRRADIEANNRIYKRAEVLSKEWCESNGKDLNGFHRVKDVSFEGEWVHVEFTWQEPLWIGTDCECYTFGLRFSVEEFCDED